MEQQLKRLEDRQQKQEVDMAKVQGDVTHIKERLDNGISRTLTKVFDKVSEMCPIVKDNAWWIGKIKGAFIWIAVMAVGGGVISLFFYFIKRGIAAGP